MIEVFDGRVLPTEQIAGTPQRLVLRPDRWVHKVAVSEPKPAPKQNSEADENALRGAAELIDGYRAVTQATTVAEAFQVWTGLCEQLANGEPVSAAAFQSAAADIARLVGRATESHAQQFFAEVKPGVGGAFFA